LSPEIVSTLLILDGRELPIAKVANKYNNLGIDRRCFAWKEDALLGERERRGVGLRETMKILSNS
jgi:hypothetical protein